MLTSESGLLLMYYATAFEVHRYINKGFLKICSFSSVFSELFVHSMRTDSSFLALENELFVRKLII
ncbi:hypothetical protein SAMN04488523_12112 [Sulfitobacter brevis]|uniref:Uncharacterized protein n=1 Tax=Sulfitobacter brevis TaxID=74348 RepID=A0A1I2G9U2_9RHOB|nr:hypothetical protein SAMN04488523_12112 [Sulfitobacter brevis]